MKFGAMLFQHRGEDLAAYAKLAEQLVLSRSGWASTSPILR